jgi:hypothetical protein
MSELMNALRDVRENVVYIGIKGVTNQNKYRTKRGVNNPVKQRTMVI